MDAIDSEEKAYVLGWIASDGYVGKGGIVIEVHHKDRLCMRGLAELIGTRVFYRRNRAIVRINSVDWVEAICAHLSIRPGKKSNSVRMPSLPEPLAWAFLRGYFDGDGSVNSLETALKRARFPAPRISITSNSNGMLSDIKRLVGTGNVSKDRIEWNGAAALDVLAKLYDNATAYLQRKRSAYLDWATWTPGLSGSGTVGQLDGFLWCKTRPDAVRPQKARASDSGYDLVLLECVKRVGPIEIYDTGIKVQPPFGYYFDLVPRSSIIKTGYMLANSLGIIDQTYVGNILVPLVRLCEGGESHPLELPARLVQLIPRKIIHAEIVEVEELSNSVRGEGGFGSTGK